MREIPLSTIQKIIAQRMLLSKCTKASFYLSVKSDVTEMFQSRGKLKRQLGIKITTNNFFTKALAEAVKEFPLINGKWHEDRIEIGEHVNIGFAVNAPQGLVVPVVQKAELKTLAQVAAEEQELTDRARNNSLTLADLEGETITLTNLGIYRIDSFYAIIPPAGSSIVSVGNIVNEPRVIEGEIINRKMVRLNLSADHRVVDSIYAAKFLRCLADKFADPMSLAAESQSVAG